MISLTLYNVTYLLSQALGVFAIYKLMKAFFNERTVNNNIEIVSFIIYYAITSSVYLVLNIPYVNFLINFTATFLLTLLYRASLKKKIFVCFIVYVFGFCTEMLVVALTGYVNFPVNSINDYNSIYGVVSANVLLLLVAIVANRFKNIKNDDVLPKSSWLALLTVPIFSLFILSMLFSLEGLTEYGVIFSITAILAMNFIVFFLFDRIAKLYCEKQESTLIRQQNRYYVNQLLLLEKLHETSGKLRHDIKNHLITIDSYLEKKDVDGARNHISSIIVTYQNKMEIVHTGFPAIDGLINFKLHSAHDSGIEVKVKTSLPSDFYFSSFDLTVILGNLIDNALRAVSTV